MTDRTLYITDLDGTLLDTSAHVSAESRRLLNLAIEAGAEFTVATARTPATVDVLLGGVDMRQPGIVLTGAAMWDFKRKLYIHPIYIPADRVDRVVEAFDHGGVTPFVYTLDPTTEAGILRVYYTDPRPTGPDAKFIADRSRLPLKRFCIGAGLPAARRDAVLLFFATGPRDRIQRVADLIASTTDCALSCYEDIYNEDTAIIEVFAAGVSKGAAVDRLRQITRADKVVVFGDNLNDLDMFAHADTAIAVGNALPEVRAAADLVIDPNTTDAVARYILSCEV